jgi:hypothetical protein
VRSPWLRGAFAARFALWFRNTDDITSSKVPAEVFQKVLEINNVSGLY